MRFGQATSDQISNSNDDDDDENDDDDGELSAQDSQKPRDNQVKIGNECLPKTGLANPGRKRASVLLDAESQKDEIFVRKRTRHALNKNDSAYNTQVHGVLVLKPPARTPEKDEEHSPKGRRISMLEDQGVTQVNRGMINLRPDRKVERNGLQTRSGVDN